jgi:hypothetical protein
MTAQAEDGIWKHCNICKKPIAYRADYLVCSVSTCNRKRTGLIFCSLPCFDAHLPTARHRDAWAEQEKAPTQSEWQATLASEAAAAAPRVAEQRVAQPAAAPGAAGPEAAKSGGVTDDHEVLVVVSKLKKYVRDWSGMNTSDNAMAVLSDHLRELCREATRQAGLDSRRTVLDRDFAKVLAERRGAEVKRRF